MSTATPAALRVVTYNVLSSHLAEPEHFTRCDPANLDATTRLTRVKAKLRREVDLGAIICLQEVSTDWAGELHVLFAAHGYHFVTGLYGRPFNGYMGVGLAWPLASFETLDVAITRVADHLPALPRAPAAIRFRLPGVPWPLLRLAERVSQPLLRWAGSIVGGAVGGKMRALGGGDRGEEPYPYPDSRRRFNQLVFARLRSRGGGGGGGSGGSGGKVVCVGTYHMPCAFMHPQVMVVHAALAVQVMKKLSGDDPQILAGDFNFKPGSSCYMLVTEGRLDRNHPEHPQPLQAPAAAAGAAAVAPLWEAAVPGALASAYAIHDGKEPDFTNNAKVRDNEPFIDTLDYIFYSPELTTAAVVPLKHRSDPAAAGPYPTAEEPSDHVLIGADLRWAEG